MTAVTPPDWAYRRFPGASDGPHRAAARPGRTPCKFKRAGASPVGPALGPQALPRPAAYFSASKGVRVISSTLRRGRRSCAPWAPWRRPLAAHSAVVLDQRLGLRVIDVEALLDGFFLVVVALHQVFAGDVVLALDLGRVVLDVVGAAGATWARGGRSCVRRSRLVGHVDLEHEVDRHAGVLHRVGLRDGAREAVEHVADLQSSCCRRP
jgi:hypothetical protein